MPLEHIIIFVPGTHRIGSALTIDRFATGIACALGADYQLDPEVTTYKLRGGGLTIRSVDRRTADGSMLRAVEIIDADYYDDFKSFTDIGLFQRAIRVVQLVLPNLSLANRIFQFEGGKELRLQLLYLALMLSVTVMTPVFLLALCVVLAGEVAYKLSPKSLEWIIAPIAGIGVVIALLKILWTDVLPKVFTEACSIFARDPICMLAYFSDRGGHHLSAGVRKRIDAAYELALQRHPQVPISIVAYSFGAIVAYDWLLPRRSAPPIVKTPQINTFVALGFPIKLVTTFWPGYFDERSFEPFPFQGFCSCVLRGDLIASVIPRESSLQKALEKNIRSENLNEHLDRVAPEGIQDKYEASRSLLSGVRAHYAYFGSDGGGAAIALARCVCALRQGKVFRAG